MIANDTLDAELAALLEREKKLKVIRAAQIRVWKLEAKLGVASRDATKTLRIIGDFVSMEFNVKWEEIMAKTRIAHICEARQVVCYIARSFGCGLSDVGRQLRVDHGTVNYAYHKIRGTMEVEALFRKRVEVLEELCRRELTKADLLPT